MAFIFEIIISILDLALSRDKAFSITNILTEIK
nr:MAG TPA: hypothetical protein [Caudoviricetes sp.]